MFLTYLTIKSVRTLQKSKITTCKYYYIILIHRVAAPVDPEKSCNYCSYFGSGSTVPERRNYLFFLIFTVVSVKDARMNKS